MKQQHAARNCASQLAIAGLILSALNPSTLTAAAEQQGRSAVSDGDNMSTAYARWGEAMRKVPPPRVGCAIAHYPALGWQEVACGVAPNIPFPPKNGRGNPFTVGNNSGDFVPHTSPGTMSADGSFQSVSAGITENGRVGGGTTSQTDAYTLQLNTNTFAPSSGCTAGSGPNCKGWEQFIYENNDTSHQTFIQYWLIAFNTTCPSGFNSFPFPGPTDISCFRNSASASLPADQPVSNLGSLTLTGQAASGSDRVTTRAGATMATTAGLNLVGLASGWTDSEFNIVGDASSNDATFGANTTLVVRTLVHNGTTNAPTCTLNSFTGETNNLTITGMSAAGPLPSPGLQFTESNIPGATATCMGASGIGDTHLRTFTGLLYDFQATGDFTLAQTGGFEAQARQISGAPTWPNAAVNQAVAARLGQFDVAVCSASKPEVTVDGNRRALSDGQIIELGDGSGIKRVGDIIILVDPHGNSLRAVLLGSHIDATVGLGHWPVAVRGLLVSGGRENTVLTGRNGATYTAPYAFGAFYGKYGESWRVTPGRSLLKICGPAKENGRPDRTLTVRNLPSAEARKARDICVSAEVRRTLLDSCIIDVTVLRDPRAARAFTTLPPPTAVGPIQ